MFCKEGRDAYFYCKDTCDNCDGTSCSDNDNVKFSVGRKDKNCEWLRNKSPIKIAKHCKVATGSYLNCKETCDSCD